MHLILLSTLLAAPPAPAPLHVAAPLIDAGEVRVGPPLVRCFAFTNAGPEPLAVTDLKASCGCLAPALAKHLYLPGERGELTLEVNTLSQPAGPNRWTVQVGYRCGDQAGEVALELTARLTREIEVRPAALAFQGDGAMTARVTIHDPRPRPLRVQSVAASSPYLRAANEGGSIRVEVGADCPEGRHAEAVTITTDDPDYRTLKVPVTVVRAAKRRVTASPARATLVAGGSALVQLRAADGTPVQVEVVESSSPALTYRWAAGPGNLATVRIGLDRAKSGGGPLTGEVRVRLRAPAGETVVIPVAVRAGE
jgi:hypothetical protein